MREAAYKFHVIDLDERRIVALTDDITHARGMVQRMNNERAVGARYAYMTAENSRRNGYSHVGSIGSVGYKDRPREADEITQPRRLLKPRRSNCIAYRDPPKEFTELTKERTIHNERRDCTVIAVAALAEVPYAEAHAMLKQKGRKDRRGPYLSVVFEALRALGCTVTRVDSRHIIQQYPGQHKGLCHLTTHHPDRFPQVWANGKRYLFDTRQHVAAVVNGRMIDWSRNRALRAVAYEVTK